ncbi:MAG: hypothetical protein JO171_17495 [Paludibacterium sp.]|uniref:hypothetical protein n=1 Tax=Paludibacterium sp. TaxID=1917523 RepID=UPI0025FED551|nr:hypothetical protein [Paludibacterium sp.]MBV8048948.1 hypothetical protein [Paludibacterium sp.]MBV8646622.1 hypothetical protein [Paludibacterium sp.]
MHISSFSLNMASQHTLRQQRSTWTQFTPLGNGTASNDLSNTQRWQSDAETLSTPAAPGQPVQRSEQHADSVNTTRSSASYQVASPNAHGAATASPLVDDDIPPLLNLAKQILEKVFGIHFTLYDGKLVPASSTGQSAGAPAVASGTQTTTTQVQEQEQTGFSASGSITTAEGQTFSFQLDSQLQRDFQGSDSVRRQVGGKDPLMITLPGGSGRFSGASATFNLDAGSGQTRLPFFADGGWLVWDKNHDGKVADGSQLFGPQSGNGFNDLAALDSNHDGVIDASDAAFADLKVWTGIDSQGNDQLSSLSSLHIGAILLPSVATPFSLRNSQNQAQGEVRRSGVYLTDNGQAGRVSQVDVDA